MPTSKYRMSQHRHEFCGTIGFSSIRFPSQREVHFNTVSLLPCVLSIFQVLLNDHYIMRSNTMQYLVHALGTAVYPSFRLPPTPALSLLL